MSDPCPSRSEAPSEEELNLRRKQQGHGSVTTTTSTAGRGPLSPYSAPPQIFVEVHDILTVISSFLSVSDSLKAGTVCRPWRVAVFDIPYLQSIREEVKRVKELKAKETDPEIEMSALRAKHPDCEKNSEDQSDGEKSDSSSRQTQKKDQSSSEDDLSSSEDEAVKRKKEKLMLKRQERKQKRKEERKKEKKITKLEESAVDTAAIHIFESSSSDDSDDDEGQDDRRGRDFPPYHGPKQLKFLARGAHMGTQLRPIDSALMVMADPQERVTHFPSSFTPEPWQHWHTDAKGLLWSGFLCHTWDIWFAFFMTFTGSGAFSAIQTGIWSGMGALTLLAVSLFYAMQTSSHGGKVGTKGFPSKFVSRFMGYLGNFIGLLMSTIGVLLFIFITSALHRTSTVPIETILLFFALGWACYFIPIIVGAAYIAYSGCLYSDRMAVEERKKAKKAKTTIPDMRRGSILCVSCTNPDGTKTRKDGKYSDYSLGVLFHGLLVQQPTTITSCTLAFCQFSTLPCKALSAFNESGIIASFLMIILAALIGYCIMSWKIIDLVERRRLACRKEGYGGFFVLSIFFWAVISLQLLFVKAHTDLAITTYEPLLAETHCKTAYGRPVYDRGALSIKITDGPDKWELNNFKWKEESSEIRSHGVTKRGVFSVTTFIHKDTECKISLMAPRQDVMVSEWELLNMNHSTKLQYIAKLPAPGQYMMTAWRLLYTDEAQGWVLRADRDSENRDLDLWSAYIPQLCPDGFSPAEKCSCTGTTCRCPLQGPCSLRLVPPKPLFSPALLWLFTALASMLLPWLLIMTRLPMTGKKKRLLTRSKSYIAQKDLWKDLKESAQ